MLSHLSQQTMVSRLIPLPSETGPLFYHLMNHNTDTLFLMNHSADTLYLMSLSINTLFLMSHSTDTPYLMNHGTDTLYLIKHSTDILYSNITLKIHDSHTLQMNFLNRNSRKAVTFYISRINTFMWQQDHLSLSLQTFSYDEIMMVYTQWHIHICII